MNLEEIVKDSRPSSRPISLAANPYYPYVAVSMSLGLVILVNVLKPEEPTVLAQFLLCNENINALHFYDKHLFTAASLGIGRVFLIKVK